MSQFPLIGTTDNTTHANWNYTQPLFTNAVPNMVWQDTTSNATYCSASSVLTSA